MDIETRIKVVEAYKTILDFRIGEINEAKNLVQFLKRGSSFVNQLHLTEDILEQEEIIHYKVQAQQLIREINKYKK